MAADAGRTKKRRKKAGATAAKSTNKTGAKAARKGASKAPAPASKSVVTVEGDLNAWIESLCTSTGRTKREVILSALTFAREHDFTMDVLVPAEVKKWLAKTGRSIA